MCLWKKQNTKLPNNRFRCRWINLERLSLCSDFLMQYQAPPLLNMVIFPWLHFVLLFCPWFCTHGGYFLTFPTSERLINDNNSLLSLWSCYFTCPSPAMLGSLKKPFKLQTVQVWLFVLSWILILLCTVYRGLLLVVVCPQQLRSFVLKPTEEQLMRLRPFVQTSDAF